MKHIFSLRIYFQSQVGSVINGFVLMMTTRPKGQECTTVKGDKYSNVQSGKVWVKGTPKAPIVPKGLSEGRR